MTAGHRGPSFAAVLTAPLKPWRLGLGLLLLGTAAIPGAGRAQAPHRLSRPDRLRLVEAFRVAHRVREQVWPGWSSTRLSVLLVTDSAEFLIGHSGPADGFTPLGHDSLLGREILTRPRRLPPTLLATFPAVGGVPTIVMGTAERTGKSSTAWVLALLHEHFHQWQYSRPGYYSGVAALDLAGGDSTGQWMLDYPFPYDSVPVQRAVRALAAALVRALDAAPASRPEGVTAVVAARDALRDRLSAADYRYFEFQLWQEGAARYVENAVARAAPRLGEDSTKMIAAARHRGLRDELEQMDLEKQRRVAFYPLGDAIARLLEKIRPGWKQAYADRPFALAALLSGRTSP